MTDQSKYLSKLQGNNILIIGGSSGIGYGVAEASIEHGAHVTISSSNKTKVDQAVTSLQKSYPSATNRIKGEQIDLGNPEEIEQNLVQLLNKCGKLDHIVWTAADHLAIKPISEVELSTIRDAATLRFIGPILLAKLAPKYLNPGPASSITFTTGSVSQRPFPNWSVVGSYATGLQGLTRGLALDLKPIRVNIVSPGGVETPLWNSMPEKERKELFASISKATTVGRIGQVEDIAECYIYFMKDKNVTGTMLSSNGGTLLLGSG